MVSVFSRYYNLDFGLSICVIVSRNVAKNFVLHYESNILLSMSNKKS